MSKQQRTTEAANPDQRVVSAATPIRTYKVYCSYFIGNKKAKRTIARNKSWDDAKELELDMQHRARCMAIKKYGRYSNWNGKIYLCQLEH